MPDKIQNPLAYPRPVSENGNTVYLGFVGMTLLDHFAGQALSGLLADPNVSATEETASTAYKVAAYMLAEREKHLANYRS